MPQCTSPARTTGGRCKSQAIRGSTVCRMHGGSAPQVRRKAAERAAFEAALRRDPARSTREIMLDCVHAADFLMRRELSGLREEQLAPEQVDRLMTSVGRAAALVESARRQGIEAEAEEATEERDARAAAEVRFWFGSLLNVMVEDWHLDSYHVTQLRRWLADAAAAYDRGEPKPPPAPLPPRPGASCHRLVPLGLGLGDRTCLRPLKPDGTCASGHLTLVLREPPSTTVEPGPVERPALPAPGVAAGRASDQPRTTTADDGSRLSDDPEATGNGSGDDPPGARRPVVTVVNPDGSATTSGRYADD